MQLVHHSCFCGKLIASIQVPSHLVQAVVSVLELSSCLVSWPPAHGCLTGGPVVL